MGSGSVVAGLAVAFKQLATLSPSELVTLIDDELRYATESHDTLPCFQLSTTTTTTHTRNDTASGSSASMPEGVDDDVRACKTSAYHGSTASSDEVADSRPTAQHVCASLKQLESGTTASAGDFDDQMKT